MNGPADAAADEWTYQALLAADVKDYSGFTSRDQGALTEALPTIMSAAFTRAGLAEVWAERRFPRTIGDEFVAGFPAAALPRLLDPFLLALQNELLDRNRTLPLGVPPRPIRMRVCVNVGLVSTSPAASISDGSGAVRVETHRLLDAPVVKDLLVRSTDSTCVAAIVSARAVDDAVVSGFDIGGYVPVPVEVKSYRGRAFLQVPNPTGDLNVHGWILRPAAATNAQERADDPAGTGNPTVTTTITNPGGPVHSGLGNQYNSVRASRRREDPRDR
jgi:hypothetical protein